MEPTPLFSPRRLRRTAAPTLFFFLWMLLHPALAAAVQAAPPAPAPAAPAGAPPAQAGALDSLRGLARLADAKARRGEDHRAEKARLLRAAEGLDEEDRQAEAEFAAALRHIEARGLPGEIRQRHAQALADYRAKMKTLRGHLDGLRQAEARRDGPAAARRLGELAGFLAKEQKGHKHPPLDPKNLPFGSPDGQARAPKERKQDLDDLIRPPKPAQVAAAALAPGLLAAADPAPSPAPTPEDLAETEDVQITQAIKDQAAALHGNPVEIHNWVRNSVEFLPTYGSIQGADLTLQTKRGNAFDTASLLIALLRASGIPARYAYGTVQIPAEQAMNWVGGVATPEAAHSLLAQGGVPVAAVASGGRITAFKLEHAWVEAYVDYVPSRGAVNKQGDTWVPLDASFKQYQHTPGMDLKAAVPLDAQALLARIQAGATVNEAEGWAQNLDGAALQTALADYQSRLKAYIDAQKPDATVGDVLGAKAIIAQNLPFLMGSLPYQVVAEGAATAALPDSLRAQYRFDLYAAADFGGGPQRGGQVLTHTVSLPKLAGGKLTLSFAPATQADADLISSYLPKPHADGSPVQPGELPASLPGYLVRLKAEYRVDGQLVAGGGSFTMGSSYIGSSALYSPDKGWEEAADNVQTAGEYWATYVGTSAPQTRLNGIKANLEQTQDKLAKFQANPGNTIPITNLTKEDLIGDLLFSTIFGYFAVNEASQRVEQKGSQAVAYRKSGFGHFGVSAKVIYRYGIPYRVSFPGLMMDIDHWRDIAVIKDNDANKRMAYLRQTGIRLSTYEHLIPEKFWTSKQNPGEGFSAVKALTKAVAEGQKIYTLTSQNISTLAQIQIDDAIRSEIQDSVNVGLTVTVHERPVVTFGWSGSGYIITDPQIGSGAYKIYGGANGGAVQLEQKLSAIFLVSGADVAVSGIASVTPYLNRATNYTGFAVNLMTSLVECYGEDLVSIAAMVSVIVATAMVISVLSGGLGAGPSVAYAVLAVSTLATTEAQAANNRDKDCKMDCKFASPAQLAAAEIDDGEGFKIEYGAVPTSKYDICACKDGSIAIFAHGQCGKIDKLWEVTDVTWRKNNG
jgi:hypothetical protein